MLSIRGTKDTAKFPMKFLVNIHCFLFKKYALLSFVVTCFQNHVWVSLSSINFMFLILQFETIWNVAHFRPFNLFQKSAHSSPKYYHSDLYLKKNNTIFKFLLNQTERVNDFNGGEKL